MKESQKYKQQSQNFYSKQKNTSSKNIQNGSTKATSSIFTPGFLSQQFIVSKEKNQNKKYKNGNNSKKNNLYDLERTLDINIEILRNYFKTTTTTMTLLNQDKKILEEIENQNCIVIETNLLYFVKNILKKITYRKRVFNDDSGLHLSPCFDRNVVDLGSENADEKFYEDSELISDECINLGLTRQKLSYLKYKLIYFVAILPLGRKKGDNIYAQIHKIIDFDVLASLLIETYKEILIERESQNHYENLYFDEDMLQRMEKDIKDIIHNNIDVNENFIIF